ncbi:MAG: ABC transporter permease [Candidatus Omnitrophica bacterium]|nr:ABC transporter permease [Candidatus Omnitrophota bacterium]
MDKIIKVLEKIGSYVIHALQLAGAIICFLIDVFATVFRRGLRPRQIADQIYELGVSAFWIVSIASLATGMVLAVQSAVVLVRFAATEYIAKLVALSLVRELGPVLTSLIFIGKSGAKVSAEIGAMNVNEQILATRALGIDPIDFFGISRILACIIVLPLLVFWCEILGILGGMLITVLQEGVSCFSYINQTFDSIRIVDFVGGMVKTLFFSLIIGIICCYKGFRTRGGSIGVGKYTTEAVALSSILVIVSNFLLTKIIINFWG